MPKNTSIRPPLTLLSEQAREEIRDTELIRMFPLSQRVTYFYRPDFTRLFMEDRIEREVSHLLRHSFTATVDLRRANDFHVPTLTIYRTPEPDQFGYVPEDDLSFGISANRYVARIGGTA